MGAERIHVLVVDDVADVAESTAELLTVWGYDATPCTSGAEALARVRVRRPAAILLDLAMPRMDGFEFARALRKVPRGGTIPLIALSGYATADCFARAREAGIGYFLLKPACPVWLKAVLALVTQVRPVPDAPTFEKWQRGQRSHRRFVPSGPGAELAPSWTD